MEEIEFFLADDIIQGEEVPFYLLWNGDNPKSIEIAYEGFKDLIEPHNAVESEIERVDGKVVFRSFQVPGYLGGLLSTEVSDRPSVHASLNVKIIFKEGETLELTEKRRLCTTRMDLKALPDEIFCDESVVNQRIDLDLSGITTIILNIEELDDNEAIIDLPDDVKEAFEKFFESLMRGLENIKAQFPNQKDLIEVMLNIPTDHTITEYIREVDENLKEAFSQDKAFLEAIVTLVLTSLVGQTSFRDVVLRPLIEYFESSAAERVLLENPFLHIKIPKEGCIMAVKINGKNVLDQECTRPLDIRVKVRAADECLIPLKDIFNIRRV
jgi:hypothetical protein